MSLCLYYSVVFMPYIVVFFIIDWQYTSSNHPVVQLFDGEYQVPVLAPDDVATVEGEGTELPGVKVFVVLRMWVATDEIANVYGAVGPIAEHQAHFQPSHIECLGYV